MPSKNSLSIARDDGQKRHDRERREGAEHHRDGEHQAGFRNPAREGEEHRKQRERAWDQTGDEPHRQSFAMRVGPATPGSQNEPKADEDKQATTRKFKSRRASHAAKSAGDQGSSDEGEQDRRSDMGQGENRSHNNRAQGRKP